MSNAALGIVPTVESECEEHKESWQDTALEALAALANTRGGILWIGVKKNGDPVEPNGWQDASVIGKMEAITDKIVSKLNIHPNSITIESLREKPVLAIKVERALTPVLLDGHYWRRVGNTSRKVPPDELTRFLLERTASQWDALPCAMSIAALDTKTIEDFKVLASARLPALRPSDDVNTILQNLQLIDDENRLLRAAVLLFGKDREAQRICPTAFVQVGRFKGNGTTIIDDRQITGNLFVQLDRVMETLRSYLQVRYEFPLEAGERTGIETLQRIEVWDYPLTALREAVANALLHRDYADSGRVMIRVYDDRLLISSPGLLPEGISIEHLSRNPHPSKLRNPLLAQAFYFTEIIERWGSGTVRMAEECAAQNLPAPEFAQVGSELHVIFYKDPYTTERLRQLGLSLSQIQAVRFVQKEGSITNTDYQELARVSKSTATRNLNELVSKGLFSQEGEKGRGTRYILRGGL